MPKVYLSEQDKLNNRLASWLYGEMKVQNISQKQLAEEMGISQQLLSYRLKNKIVSFTDFATFVKVFQPEESEVMRLIGK